MPTKLLSKREKSQELDALQIPLLDEQAINFLVKDSRKLLKIQNRRYLGNKSKLIDFIRKIVKDKCGNFESFCDIFAGTGIVGYSFSNPSRKIISNELLYSNYISLNAWLSPEKFDNKKMLSYIDGLNGISSKNENYISKNFGGTFFSEDNARKIGAIREKIDDYKLNFKERSILLTSLLYAMDKVANTCGHYDAYRKKMDSVSPMQLLMPDIDQRNNELNEIYNEDSNILVRKLCVDVLYIDPPYNSRQYSDTYHLLENVIRWQKPEVYGKAKKMRRGSLKSSYCTKYAPKAFFDLISSAKCKYILVSFNNMGEKGNGRSNARIKDEEIRRTLSSRGRVEVFENKFKSFSAGKSKIDDHSERIFFCKVTRG